MTGSSARGGVVGYESEDRAAPEPLGRGPEAEDQLTDRATSARIPVVDQLRASLESPAAERDLGRGLVQQVGGPGRIRRAGGNEDGAVRLFDESDRDLAPLPGPAPGRREPDEALVAGQSRVDRGRPLGPTGRTACSAGIAVGRGRQRLRCQDLPSVATDGA